MEHIMTDNVVKLLNNAVAPEIIARSGSITLNFGRDDRETVELEGSLTLSEICFLKEILASWIHNKMQDLSDDCPDT